MAFPIASRSARHARQSIVWLVLLAAGAWGASASAQEPAHPRPSARANYRLAARFAPYQMSDMLHSTIVTPRWIEGGERFWYEWETTDGKFFHLVDPVAGTKRQIFDNDRIAAELTRITLDPWDGQHLPIRAIRFIDGNTLQFEVESSQDEERVDAEEERGDQQRRGQSRRPRPKKKVFHFQYDVRTQTLRELTDYEHPDNHPSWASVSPDSQTIVFSRHHNLYMMNVEAYRQILDARRGKEGAAADSADWKVEVDEVQLTTDGEEYYDYGGRGFGDTDVERERSKDRRKGANISWSRDSKRFALVRRDQRRSGALWVIHSVGNDRPELETYKYDMPGDTTVAQAELLVYDLAARNMVTVQADRFKDQQVSLFDARQFRYPDSEAPRRSLWLAENSDQVYFWRRSRDQHRVDVCVANATTGEVTVLIEERLNTYVESQDLELLSSGDMLWWSERDGWAHLYRFGPDGTLKQRLTEGPWHVEGITGIDETRGFVYFVGNAREPGEDPYYQHHYRVGVDGRGLTLLNPGDFDHQVANLRRNAYGGFNQQPGLSPGTRYFVDNYSRVNTVPASALFDGVTGRKVLDLEEADLSALMAAGYRFPQPYRVKSADGITDLYGVMYTPFDFDSTRQYPIIVYVYPGPQTEAVSKAFSTAPTETGMTQLGFIIVTVGNRGGHPARSKWYHNYGYGNLRDYGLADKKAAVEQLAQRHGFIDVDRVGIYGHSGGGFMSTAAMLVYPDFFKVAVSSSGNHENNVYNQNWSEKHHGVREVERGDTVTFEYDIARNSQLAANLKGHLLLTTGGIDNNVHHANTYRMAEALIDANKRFDFFVFPSQRHGYRGHSGDYWFWLRAEYFARHLLGDQRSHVNIVELDVDRAQTGARGGGRSP
ncbi:MAG TPA: DPP IV N-terminal domain-containing protein [Gemmatimonadales bacterium]